MKTTPGPCVEETAVGFGVVVRFDERGIRHAVLEGDHQQY